MIGPHSANKHHALVASSVVKSKYASNLIILLAQSCSGRAAVCTILESMIVSNESADDEIKSIGKAGDQY